MDEPTRGVEIPHTALSSEALRGLAQEFVTRDGTDYGSVELCEEEKVARLVRQLETGKARITFDPETESVNVVATQELAEAART